MKTIHKVLSSSLFGLSLLFFSVESKAIENFEVVVAENSPKIVMEVKTPSSQVIEVYLMNNREREIFNQRVDLGETMESQFDFTGYETGTYTLVTEAANLRVKRTIELSGNQVNILKENISFLPLFKQVDGLLMVQFINDGLNDLGISIEKNNEVVLDEYYNTTEFTFNQVYSLENLTAGTYTFHIASQGEFYKHEFVVE